MTCQDATDVWDIDLPWSLVPELCSRAIEILVRRTERNLLHSVLAAKQANAGAVNGSSVSGYVVRSVSHLSNLRRLEI
jgi:hypothetical protein